MRDVAEGKGRCDLLPMSVVGGFLKFWDTTPSNWLGIPVLDCLQILMDPPHTAKGNRDMVYTALDSFGKQVGWNIPTMILEVAHHFEAGCAKYGERNWEKGIPCHCYIDSAVRHYLKWYRGDEDEPHDRAFVWNLLCLLWTLENRPECNDLWGDDDGDGR